MVTPNHRRRGAMFTKTLLNRGISSFRIVPLVRPKLLVVVPTVVVVVVVVVVVAK